MLRCHKKGLVNQHRTSLNFQNSIFLYILQYCPFPVFPEWFVFAKYIIYWPSQIAQLVKNLPAMQETPVHSWVGKVPWRRERLPTPVFWPGKFHEPYSRWGHMSEFCTDKCLRNFLNYFLRALSDSNYCWGTPNTDLPL